VRERATENSMPAHEESAGISLPKLTKAKLGLGRYMFNYSVAAPEIVVFNSEYSQVQPIG